jgi:RNA polymerase sigma-70 factor, ECF subfamily
MGRSSGSSAPDGRGGTTTVGPLFGRPSRMPGCTGPQHEQEWTLSALRRARGGDADAFGYLYRRYAAGVFSYVRRIVRNDYDAQDVTQQAFVKLATSLDKYDVRRPGFSSWMLRLAHNVAVDHLRKQRLTLLSDPMEASEETDRFDPDDGRSLRETFKALSRAQREVLFLREVVGLTPSEVARRLDKSEAAVNTCHHRARRAAIRSLTALGSTPATRTCDARRAA